MKDIGDLFRSYMEENESFNSTTEIPKDKPTLTPDQIVPIKSIDADAQSITNDDKIKLIKTFVQNVGMAMQPVMNNMAQFPFTSVEVIIKRTDVKDKLEMDVKIQY